MTRDSKGSARDVRSRIIAADDDVTPIHDSAGKRGSQ
jgi:hypothetical protein